MLPEIQPFLYTFNYHILLAYGQYYFHSEPTEENENLRSVISIDPYL